MASGSRLRRLLARCWHGVALVVIAAAVLLTLVRIALPWLSSYRGELAQVVSGYVEAPVAIGGLAVQWRNLSPRLELTDVRVGEGPRAALHFERAAIDLGLAWDSALRVPLRIEGIELGGLDVRARVDERGRIHWRAFTLNPVGGLGEGPASTDATTQGEGAGVPRGLEWLLSVDELSLRDIRIRLDTPEGARELADTDVRLVNRGRRHRLALRSSGLAGDQGDLRLTVALDEPQSGEGAWGWRAHAATEGLDVARWHALARLEAMADSRGRLRGEAWAAGEGWQPQRALADARVDELELRSPATGQRFAADRLSGRWLWQRRPAGWSVAADEVVLERDGRAWPATSLAVEHASPSKGPARSRLRASFLDIADVAAAARLVPLPERVRQRLTKHRPRGEARDVALRWAADGSGLSLQARFDDLGWRPSRTFPGITGVDARLRGDTDGATLDVATQAGEVRMPRFFRAPIPVAHAEGRIRLRYGDDRLRVDSDRFRLANGDVTASTRFALRIGPRQPPEVDFLAEFGEADLSALSRYLPVKDMDPEAVEWLDRGLNSGRVSNGTVLWRGPIEAFPYRGNEGHFSIDFDVAEAEVAFDPEWPAVREGYGHVRIDGPALTVVGDRGRFLDGTVRALRVRFDDLDRPFVDVAAQGRLPMSDIIQLATETPLREELGEGFRGAEGSGRVDAHLRLAIPLDNVDAAGVDGRFRVDGAALHQPRFGLDLTGIRGQGEFDDKGVSIEGMRARQKGRPVEIAARPSDEPSPRVRFVLTGALTPRELLPSDMHALAECCDGRSRWRVAANVPTGDDADERPVIVTSRSDLAGTAVRMPAPFAKPRQARRRLETRVRIAPASDRARVWLDYGGDIRGVFQLVGDHEDVRVTRSMIRFASGDPTLADEPGMRLTGRIDRLDVRSWLDWLDRRDEPGAGGSSGLRVTHADLTIARAHYGAFEATDVTAQARRKEDAIRLELAGGALVGELVIPTSRAADRSLRGRFERVDLALLRPDAGADADEPQPAPAVGDLPPLDVRVDRLKLRYGTLQDGVLVSRPTRSGQRIHRLGFDAPGFSARADGHWRGGGDGRGRTQLNIKLEGDDFGRGLAAFGFGSFLEGGAGETRAQLSWPGAPWAPRLADLRGHTDVRLEQGRLEQLDVGPARLLGLFSLDASGFLRSGFSFDEIEGRIELADGNAYTRDVVIVGAPGRIRVQGRTGLVARDYDQRVMFQPQISGSLTALGLLSGGPAAGLGMAFVQGLMEVLGADVDEVAEFEYRLTGSWADPNVHLVTPEPPEPTSSEPRQRRPGR